MGLVDVEVVYAEADRAWARKIGVPAGSTVRDALEMSGILAELPAVDLERNRVGIYGALVKLEDRVAAGDRIELYRPLLADPKEIRRRRAARSRALR